MASNGLLACQLRSQLLKACITGNNGGLNSVFNHAWPT
jgi:hypothetical protein